LAIFTFISPNPLLNRRPVKEYVAFGRPEEVNLLFEHTLPYFLLLLVCPSYPVSPANSFFVTYTLLRVMASSKKAGCPVQHGYPSLFLQDFDSCVAVNNPTIRFAPLGFVDSRA
jgi:hypothetical protein